MDGVERGFSVFKLKCFHYELKQYAAFKTVNEITYKKAFHENC
jgi:hypothetical protein